MEQPQQQQARPRSKSNFSFHSDKSRDTPSRAKHERKESASEKRKTHYDPTTKANPNAAMNEAQPSMPATLLPASTSSGLDSVLANPLTVAAALEKPTLQSLRSFQHSDSAGNPIGGSPSP